MKEALQPLLEDQLYQDWHKQHPHSYLSHFFRQIDASFCFKTPWEIGFFDEETGKITVFVEGSKGIEIRPADEVFQKEQVAVEKLDLDRVKILLDDALSAARKMLPNEFPSETLGDGFVILQAFRKKVLWNFTFITKSLKFVNLKINAATGREESHQEVELLERKLK